MPAASPLAGLDPAELATSIEGHYPADRALVVQPRFAAVNPAWIARLVVAGRNGPVRLVRSDTGDEIARVGHGSGRTMAVPAHDCADLDDPVERHHGAMAVQKRLVERWARAGVWFEDLDNVTVHATVSLTSGVTVGRGVVITGTSKLASGASVGHGSVLHDTAVGADSVIKPHTVASGATIGAGCAVGPFAHLREGAILEDGVKVGNFVEVKKTLLRAGAKASHLTYLGDAEVGPGANIGAGTITCNYDGYGKHQTKIGAGAFIGSNTSLVAPVTVGDGAIVGAGSVITRDVPDQALAVERTDQRTLADYAPKVRARNAHRAGKEP